MKDHAKEITVQPLVVACSMDFDRDEYLVCQAGRLAMHLGAPLHLVHSLEPFRYHHWIDSARSREGDADQTAESQLPNGNVFRTAMSVLNKLAQLVEFQLPEVEITANVLSGSPADAVVLEAAAVNALAIIVGAADQTRILSSLSTTRVLLTKLTSSAVPVLIISDDCATDFSGARLNILIADSLHDQALLPLKAAAAIKSRSGQACLIHAHIKNAHFKFFQRRKKSLSKEQSERILAKIRKRAERAGALFLDQLGAYIPVVAEGNPNMELHQLADRYSADIIVFGKHKIFHAEDTKLGTVSTSGMLTHKSAVMVVPA